MAGAEVDAVAPTGGCVKEDAVALGAPLPELGGGDPGSVRGTGQE